MIKCRFNGGDFVKFKEEYNLNSSNQFVEGSYMVIGYKQDEDVIILDSTFIIGGIEQYLVHDSYMEIDIKRTRQEKMKQIFND